MSKIKIWIVVIILIIAVFLLNEKINSNAENNKDLVTMMPTTIELNTVYVVGEDIEPGKYDVGIEEWKNVSCSDILECSDETVELWINGEQDTTLTESHDVTIIELEKGDEVG